MSSSVSIWLRIALALAILPATAAMQGCHPQAPPDYGPIRVLAAFNLTGSGSELDRAAFYGARIAARHINDAGGVRGRSIQLIAVDTAGNTSVAVRAVKRALDTESAVAAGIGYCDSTFAEKVGALFQRSGLPFISPGATDPEVPGRVGNMLFFAAYGDDAQGRAMAEFAYEQLGKRELAIWMDEAQDYSTTVASFVATAFEDLGGRVQVHTEAPEVDDFSAFVEALRSTKPDFDAIYAGTMPEQAVAFVTQVRADDIEVPLLSGDGWDGAPWVEVSESKGLSNIYFTTHRFLDVNTSAMEEFVEAFTLAHGAAPTNAFAALGYDALGLLADAMKRAGSTKPSAVRAALAATTDYQGLAGPISYQNGSRVPIKPVAIVAVDRGHETVVSTVTP